MSLIPLKSNPALVPYSLFDFANSGYVLIFHAYLFPLYFRQVLMQNRTGSDLMWGLLISGSVLIAMATAPFLGAIADGKGRHRVFSLACLVSFASALVFPIVLGYGLATVIISFLVMNILYYIAETLYDSLVTVTSDRSQRAAFSSFSWGFGYVGGVLCFVLVYLTQQMSPEHIRLPYLVTSMFYVIFGLLSVLLLKRHVVGYVRINTVTLKDTLSLLSRSRVMILIGYFLLSDGVGAIILFASVYGSGTLGLSTATIGMYLLIVQVVAFPATYLMSRLAGRIGLTRTLGVCVAIWMAIIVIGVSKPGNIGMLAIGLLTAIVIGSTQALMRAQYSLYLDAVRTSETFGWYAIATRSSTFLAPIVFGTVSSYLGGQRVAMAVLAVFIASGWIFLQSGVKGLERTFEEGSPV